MDVSQNSQVDLLYLTNPNFKLKYNKQIKKLVNEEDLKFYRKRVLQETKDMLRGNRITTVIDNAFENFVNELIKHYKFIDKKQIIQNEYKDLSERKSKLSDLISERKNRFPSSGELNFTVADSAKCLKKVKELLASDAELVEELDGLSMSFENWRFNLRTSNTEPLVRLNVETRGDHSLLTEKTEELKVLIKGFII